MLNPKEYPAHLRKIFKSWTKRNLNIYSPDTLSEKIQWLKLYDCSPLKTELTDKILVRDWIKDKIGEEYLKPVLWCGKSFDEIPFEILPDSFIIKTNHGCKWNFVIKNKEEFLKYSRLYKIVENKFNSWMRLNFSFFSGFEMQYRNIKPKLLVEPLLTEDINQKPVEFEVYCFNGEIKFTLKKEAGMVYVWDEKLNVSDVFLSLTYIHNYAQADDTVRKIIYLSSKLAKGFKLVRVDWIFYKEKIYFNEMTFTPWSGNFYFLDKKTDLKLGAMLELN